MGLFKRFAERAIESRIESKMPDDAIREHPLALQRMIKEAERYIQSGSSELDFEEFQLGYRIHDNLAGLEFVTELMNDLKAIESEMSSAGNSAWQKRDYYNTRFIKALQTFLLKARCTYYENEIDCRKFTLYGKFNFGTQQEVRRYLESLGGNFCSGGVYCDYYIVGSAGDNSNDAHARAESELDMCHALGQIVSESEFSLLNA